MRGPKVARRGVGLRVNWTDGAKHQVMVRLGDGRRLSSTPASGVKRATTRTIRLRGLLACGVSGPRASVRIS